MALFFWQKYFKRKEMADEQRAQVLAKENILILKSINSIGKLTYANALAIQNQTLNGEMTEAMDIYEEINNELYEYLLEQNAHK